MGYNTSRYRLGDLCEFYRGASVPRTRMHDSGDCLYIHYGDLYKGFSYCIDVERQQKPIPYILSSEKIKDEQRLLDQDIVYVLICPEPRQAARHPMSARPEPPGPAGRSLPLPNAPGSASCPHETMRASCSFSYPRIPRCRGPHIGVPAWRQDSTLTPCVTGMPAAHRPFASAAGVSRNQGALPGAFQISQAPAGPPSIPCL